jgi:hypothetical protein
MWLTNAPNALRISRAATIDRDRLHAMIPRKMATISVAGTASGCMRWLGGTTPEGRADLPDVLAPEGGAWHAVRGHSSTTRLDAMAVACLPWDGARGRCRRWRSHALAVGCVAWDGVRGRCRCWPVQAGDACPAIAVGCPIHTGWRSGCSNHGVESSAGLQSHGLLVPAQRLAHQPRRPDRLGTSSRHDSTNNRHDLARRAAASGCMRWLGGTTPDARADLPAMLAPEGDAWHDTRGRSASAMVDAMTVACVPRDGVRGRCRRFRSHRDGRRMRGLGWRSRAFPVLACPRTGCVARDGARMPDSRALAVGPQQSRG